MIKMFFYKECEICYFISYLALLVWILMNFDEQNLWLYSIKTLLTKQLCQNLSLGHFYESE